MQQKELVRLRSILQLYVNNGLRIFIFIFIYLLQLGCHPVAVVILHVNKT